MLATEGFSSYVWNNQLKSILLLMGFPLLLLIMLFAFFALKSTVGPDGSISPDMAFHAGWQGLREDGIFAVAAAGVWFVIAYFFQGALMRMATGSHPITRQQMPRIYNLLENLCISRGIPMPQFEVIDSPALNAFATGIDEKSYKIVLTRGIIDRLSDDELESVIGHELTHIMNRDARLLVISVIFVGMISFLCHGIFRVLSYGGRPNYYRSSGRNDKGGGIVILLIALAVLAVGYAFAIVIRFALSRKREFLADAGSVELTKNPDAMMRALQRIAGNDSVPGMSDQVQQMCIENSHNFMGIFATHPPIPDRLAAISRTTGTPIPAQTVSLRRGPDEPWDGNKPPPAAAPISGPWAK